jgi:predicted ATPase/class 3 adenylate cyclase
MPELPTGTVTFLFTDLEGSTRLWEEHPEAMRDALARHDEILRDAVEKRRGHVVKTTGDGLHAAFAVAADAVAAATDAQRVLVEEAWALPEPLRVRMGLHTGGAEVRDGDYYGPAVNRAARVSAAAHGGQVVVSHATEELIRDDLPAGAALTDLGEHRLRDLARPERIYQIDAPGLPDDFPPLRSIDAFPSNLPLQLSSFVGREREIANIAKELHEARLVTLTGVGGVGKTRLSIQVAAEVLPHYPDGAWLCELAAAADPETLVQVVAATLGVSPRPGLDLAASILEYLRTRELLVVLDNCEHLLDAAGRLSEGILRECSEVRILATSREGLGVEGEHLVALRSLGIPDAGAGRDAVAGADSARLFLERAHAAQADFDLDDAAADAVAEICRRLDGIPLAIELAAARVVAMHPREIAERLDERFRLLTGGRRTAVERHHTLRATVDWSYSLLAEREQTVFDRLGVFAGSFDTRAAEAVTSGDRIEEWDVVDALADLVAKSMVTADRATGTTRYQLLETLRQYAREQLDEHGTSDTWRRRHAQHYATFAEEVGPGLRSSDELAWRTRLTLDLDNLRAAVTWSIDRDDPDDVELGLRIVAALATQATLNRTFGVGAWAERAAPKVEQDSPARRCAVLGAAASAAYQRGDVTRSEELVREATRNGIPADPAAISSAWVIASMLHAQAGDYERALEVISEAVQTVDEIDGDLIDRTGMHGSAAYWALMGGDETRARAEAETALALARRSGSPSALAIGLLTFGFTWWKDDPDAALRAMEEGTQLVRAGATDANFGGALIASALIHARRDETGPALAFLREGIAREHDTGDRGVVASTLFTVVDVLGAIGESEAAGVVVGVVTAGCMADMGFHGDPEGFERGRDEAERALGPNAYDAAVARGAAMSFDEAATYALGELDRILAELPDA